MVARVCLFPVLGVLYRGTCCVCVRVDISVANVGTCPGDSSLFAGQVTRLETQDLVLIAHTFCCCSSIQVRDVFSKPAYQCPELLLLALAAVPSEAGGNLRVEMLSRLLPLYFRPNRNKHAAALIRRLWQVNARLVVQSGVKAFNVDSTLPSVVYVSCCCWRWWCVRGGEGERVLWFVLPLLQAALGSA